MPPPKGTLSFPVIDSAAYQKQCETEAERGRVAAAAAKAAREAREAAERAAAANKPQLKRGPKPKLRDSEPVDKGPKSKATSKRNWWHPAVFGRILSMLRRKNWQVRTAVNALKFDDPVTFKGLSERTVRGWLDRDTGATLGAPARLNAMAIKLMEQQSCFPRPNNGTRPILAGQPEAEAEIKTTLEALRAKGATISLQSAAAVVTAVCEKRCRDLLAANGGKFKVSGAWMSRWLFLNLGWVHRRSTTGGGQKLPPDAAKQVEDMCQRLGILAAIYEIPPELVIAMDETFFFYVPMGGACTFAAEGSKNVSVAGAEDKRGGTVALACTAAGEMLPFAAIYGGKTKESQPGGKKNDSEEAKATRAKAQAAGHIITSSISHWQTEDTYKECWDGPIYTAYRKGVAKLAAENKIKGGRVAWEKGKEPFDPKKHQACVVFVDVYPVHTKAEVREWVRTNHPYARVLLVPAGCTGIAQIPDIAINRPWKACMKICFQTWVTAELTAQLKAGTAPADLQLDLESIGAIRNKSLAWLLDAHERMSSDELRAGIVKAWEKVGYLKAWDRDYQLTALTQQPRLFPRLSPGDPATAIGGAGCPTRTLQQAECEAATGQGQEEEGLEEEDWEDLVPLPVLQAYLLRHGGKATPPPAEGEDPDSGMMVGGAGGVEADLSAHYMQVLLEVLNNSGS